ncbi:MAG: hypothetical protein ABH813_01960 [Patescibacteria group bacterium]
MLRGKMNEGGSFTMEFSARSKVAWRNPGSGEIHDEHGNIWKPVLWEIGEIPEFIARTWTQKYDEWPNWLLVATFEDTLEHPRPMPVGILRRQGYFYLYQLDRTRKPVDVATDPNSIRE